MDFLLESLKRNNNNIADKVSTNSKRPKKNGLNFSVNCSFRWKIRKLKSTFETKTRSVFGTISLLLFDDSGVCLPFTKGNDLTLKNLEKENLSANNFQNFPENNHHDLCKSSLRSLTLKKHRRSQNSFELFIRTNWHFFRGDRN